MREVQLTKGFVAVVDDEDHSLVAKFKWHVLRNGPRTYAVSDAQVGPYKHRNVYMHRLILAAKPGEICDHRDGDGLNNTRENLRTVTASVNVLNQRPQARNSLGYRGVFRKGSRYGAKIAKGGVVYRLGLFDSAEAAGEAYETKAVELYGNDAPASKLPWGPRPRPDLSDMRHALGFSA